MSDIVFGMEIELEGGEKVRGQFVSTSKAAEQLEDSVGKTGTKAKQAGTEIDKFGTETEKAGEKTKKTNSFLKNMFNEFFSLKGLIAGIGFGLMTQQIIDVGNVTEGWASAMYSVTESHQLANQELKNTRSFINELGLEIKSATTSYVSFAAATKDSSLEGFQTTKIYEAVSGAMRVLNRSADDTTGALRALEQMVSKGNVQAEELRGQLGERLPGAFRLAADAMGVTTQELNKMLEQGQVLASDLLPKLADALNAKYGKALAEALESPAQKFRQLNNEWFEFKEAISGQAFEPLANGAGVLAGALDSAGSSLGALTNAVVAAGAVYAASFIPAISAILVKQYQMVVGTQMASAAEAQYAKTQLASAAAIASSARANVGLTTTRINDLKSVIAQYEAETLLENTRLKAQITDQGRVLTTRRMAELQTARLAIVKQLSLAEAQLTVNTQAASIAETGQTTATAALATAQTAATRTSYALGVASRFLFGPFGLLLTVVGAATAAFYLTAEEATKTSEVFRDHGAAVDDLTINYKELTKAQLDSARISVNQRLAEIEKEISGLEKLKSIKDGFTDLSDSDLSGLGGLLGWSDEDMKNAATAAIDTQAAIDTLKQEAKKLNEILADSAGLTGEVLDDLRAEYDALLQKIDPTIKKQNEYAQVSEKLTKLLNEGAISMGEYLHASNLLTAGWIDSTNANADLIDGLKAQNASFQQSALQNAIDIELKKLDVNATKEQKKEIEELIKARFQLNSLSANGGYITELTKQLELTQYFGKELAVQIALKQLDANATQPQIDKVRELTESLYDQAEAIKESNELDDFYKNAIDGVNGYSNAWASAGNVIIDTFGSIGQQMEKLFVSQEAYTKAIEINHAKQQELGADTKKLKLEEYQLNFANTQAQLNSYSSIAGAAGDMFKENSKARKLAHALEQSLAVASLAMSIEKMLMSSSETAVVVANETVKQTALGTTAIISQGQGDPYTAWVRIAAMIALVAGLGIATRGTSSGGGAQSAAEVQASQGTGSVLGSDDKSESLVNSFERFEDIELDQLAELQGIRQSMRQLNDGIAQLAKSFVTGLDFNGGSYEGPLGKTQSSSEKVNLAVKLGLSEELGIFGDNFIGPVLSALFGDTKKKLIDSGITFLSQTLGEVLESGDVQANLYNTIETTKKKFFGLSKTTKTSIEYSDLDSAISQQMADIFGFVGESILDAADLLGFSSAAGKLDSFKINLPQISFKDLSGEEIQKELEAIFSQQADLIATYLIPSITNYQQIGEGAYETLLRVAQEQAVFNDHLERTGVVLSGLSNIDLIDVSQNIITLMGGLDAFKEASNTFFTEFFSEQEQFAYLQKSLSEVLATMNLSLPENRDGFKALVQGIDITTDAGAALYATLLQVSGSAAEYYKQLESQNGVMQDNSKLLAQRAEFENDIADALARMDFTGLQTALVDLNTWYTNQIEQAAALGADTTLLEQLYGRKRADVIADALTAINTKTESEMTSLTKTHESAVGALTADYQQLFDAISAVSATIASSVLELQRAMSGWNEIAYQAAEVNRLRNELGTGDIAQQTNAVEQLIAATMNKWRAELAVNDAAISKTEQLIGEHESAVAELDSTYSDLFSTINSVAGSISSSILAIRRSMSGWNEVGYQNTNISQLYGQVGAGSIAEQTNTVQGLMDAINARYQAELANNNELSTAANERYQAELSAYESLKTAAESLKKAADSLLLGDLSYLSQGDQLAEAKKQYEQALASGDIANLQSAGTDYLKIAQEYFSTGSNQYGDIFDRVNSAFRSVNVGGAPSAPAVNQYQNDNLALQQSTIDELSGLQLLLDDLNAQALAQQELEAAALQEQLTGLNTELLALQLNANELAQLAIDEISSLQLLLNDLNTQAIAQQTTDLTALQSTLDADLVALLASSAEQINAVNAMSNNIVAAINAIDVAPVIIAPAAPAPTTSTTETKTTTNSNVADFSRDVLPVAQNNDDVVTAVKAVKEEMINMRRDLKETNSLVYSNMRIA